MSFWFADFCSVGDWALIPLSLNYSIVWDGWCFLSLALVLIDTFNREVELWVFLFNRFAFIRSANKGILRRCHKHGSSACLTYTCYRWLIASDSTADREVTFFQLLSLLCHLALSCSETIIWILLWATLINATVSFFSMTALLQTCQRSVITICSAMSNVDCVRIWNTQLANLVKLRFGCR